MSIVAKRSPISATAELLLKNMAKTIYTVFHKKSGSTFVIIALENLDGFNNFYIPGKNGNECPLQVSYLLILHET